MHELVLQFHIGARVRKLEQFLRGPQISAGYSLDETGHALLQILKAAPVLERIRKDYGTSPRVPEALYKLGLLALEPDNPKASANEA